MTTYNTGNPVPSADARDRYDNSQTFDEVVNGGLTYYANRAGNNVLSFKGMADLFNAAQLERLTAFAEAQVDRTNQFNQFLTDTAYELPPIPFVDGSPLEIARATQLVSYGGNLYSVKLPASFPVVLSGVWDVAAASLTVRSDQSLRQQLADQSGSDLLGWKRTKPNVQISRAGQALNGVAPSPWEYADLVVDRPTEDPTTWDWAPAINEALAQWGSIMLPMGSLGVASEIKYISGMIIRGHGPGNAGGFEYSEVFGSTLRVRADFTGEAVIYGRAVSPENVLTAPQFEQFRLDLSLCPSHGVVLEDVYDGCTFYNVHITGVEKTKRGLWFKRGSYNLGQTVAMINCQIMGRSNSDGTVAPFFAECLNESNFIGCKFFGSMGGINASMGAAAEFSGCSGQTNIGCSYAFADVGILIREAEGRKTNGFYQGGCSYEALRTTATKVRGTAALMSTQITVDGPRYYDSVFAFANAVDADFCEQSEFQCHFKRAIVGEGSDQNVVYAQRQNYLTDSGLNTTIISHPNASDPYYGINKRFRATGGLTAVGTLIAEGGLSSRVATYTASPAKIPASARFVIVDRATLGTYELPLASVMGAGFTTEINVRSVGVGSISLTRADGSSDTVEGGASLTIPSGGKATMISDGVSKWFSL